MIFHASPDFHRPYKRLFFSNKSVANHLFCSFHRHYKIRQLVDNYQLKELPRQETPHEYPSTDENEKTPIL